MSSRAWRTFERYRYQMEVKHLPAVKRALDNQIKFFADLVERGEDISLVLPIDEFYDVILELYKDTGARFAGWQARELERTMKRFNVDESYVQEIINYFRLHIYNKSILRITDTTRDIVFEVLAKGAEEGWGARRTAQEIIARGVDLNRMRAVRITRTETVRAANLGKWSAAKNFQFLTDKVWVSAGDNRVRPQPNFSPGAANHIAMNGQRIGLNETFTNGCKFPGDPEASPDETIQCRCTLIFRQVKDSEGRPILASTGQPVGRPARQLA